MSTDGAEKRTRTGRVVAYLRPPEGDPCTTYQTCPTCLGEGEIQVGAAVCPEEGCQRVSTKRMRRHANWDWFYCDGCNRDFPVGRGKVASWVEGVRVTSEVTAAGVTVRADVDSVGGEWSVAGDGETVTFACLALQERFYDRLGETPAKVVDQARLLFWRATLVAALECYEGVARSGLEGN